MQAVWARGPELEGTLRAASPVTARAHRRLCGWDGAGGGRLSESARVRTRKGTPVAASPLDSMDAARWPRWARQWAVGAAMFFGDDYLVMPRDAI